MIEVIFDASQLENYEACPRKWFYNQILNLEPYRSNPALSKGSWYHECLKHYYHMFPPLFAGTPLPMYQRRMLTLRFAVDSALLKKYGLKSQEDIKFHTDRLDSYLRYWETDDEQTDVLAVEQGFSYLLYEDDDFRYIAEGKVDLIGRCRGMQLFVRDHKTQSRKDSIYPISHQPMNYLTATGATHFEYDYIGLQATLPDDGFRREVYAPPEGVLKHWKNSAMETFTEHADRLYVIQAVGDSILDSESLFPRRLHACDSHKYGQCQYWKICSVDDNNKFRPAILSHYKEKEPWRAWS